MTPPPEAASNAASQSPADRILVLDYGSQYTQLIARRIREQHVYCEILPADTPVDDIRAWAPRGIILSGGPNSVFDDDSPSLDLALLDLGLPVLGICYGLQLLTHKLGGRVEPADDREYGRAALRLEGLDDPLFAGFGSGGERRVRRAGSPQSAGANQLSDACSRASG